MSPEEHPLVTIVIPTYDGHDTLPTTLHAVARQSYPRDRLELIVVDDGSAVGPDEELILSPERPTTWLRQEHGGPAAARNLGASHARGSILVFLDDDVEAAPSAVAELVAAHRLLPRSVVTGWLKTPSAATCFEQLEVARPVAPSEGIAAIGCSECFTGLLSVTATDFAAIGGFRDPTGGWPSWDDIDFGHRALVAGLRLFRCSPAAAVHHDRVSRDLDSLCRRWYAASSSAVRLFQVHPGIQREFEIYRDKLPIAWGRDRWTLVGRKALRAVASSPPANAALRRAGARLATRSATASVARPLCALALSGSMWAGVREGLTRYGPLPGEPD